MPTYLIDGTTPLPENGETGWGTKLNTAITEIDERFTWTGGEAVVNKVAASGITGTTLPSTLVTSSLTTVGTLTGLSVAGNVTITGDFTVNGTTTTINTTTLNVSDNLVVLNNDVTGSPTENAGIEVERGTSTNVLLRWNETSDRWELTNDGSTYGEIVTGATTSAVVTSAMIVNGTIVDADISSSAAIALSKLAAGTAGNILVYNSSGVLTSVTETGDVTIDSSGVASISSGVIVNADISNSAAIALSKLATGTAGTVVLHNASGVPTATTISGDITINSSGVASIAANSVALGTDTTGNYVADITAGTGVTVVHTPGEGSSPTVSIGQAVATTSTPLFAGLTTTGPATIAGSSGGVSVPLTVHGASSQMTNLQEWRATSPSSPVVANVSANGAITGTALFANGIRIGIAAANEIDTNAGNLTIDSAGGTVTVDDNLTVTGTTVLGPSSIVNQPLATYTLALSDQGKVLETTHVSGATITIPAETTANFPVGSQITVIRNSSGSVQFQPAAGVTIRSDASKLFISTQYSAATLVKRGTNEWYLFGNLSAS